MSEDDLTAFPCRKCGERFRLIRQLPSFRRYACGCEGEHTTLLRDGVEYRLGSAGSLLLCCPECGADHFRDAEHYFEHPEWHTCVACSMLIGKRVHVEPVKVADLARWRAFWDALDFRDAIGDAFVKDGQLVEMVPAPSERHGQHGSSSSSSPDPEPDQGPHHDR